MSNYWEDLPVPPFVSEADVELRVVLPLLAALGYESSDISPKYAVTFQEGRKGRKPEADFAVFDGTGRTLNDSLLVVEAKALGESFSDAKSQCESYSQNLRASFYVLTDGEHIEVWQTQISGESNRLIRCRVQDLAENRGSIESAISKESARIYSKSILRPDALLLARDTSKFITAERERQLRYSNTIPRTLRFYRGTSLERLGSEDLLRHFPQGALVEGPSGFGKSSLARQLHIRSLTHFATGEDLRIPLYIYLPDVVASGYRVEEYARQRVAGHCPSISSGTFRDLLRESGALLFCDGFDRVLDNRKEAIEENLRSLANDFPKLRLFVFSRPSAVPSLSLPRLTLEGLSQEEQKSLIETTNQPESARFLLSSMPEALRNLAFHPLLLSRIDQYWRANRTFPTQLQELFEAWLEQILENVAPSVKIDIRAALAFVATETRDSVLTASQLLGELRQRSLPDTVYNMLANGDGVRVSAQSIEIQHEALADYLRAVDAMNAPDRLGALLSAQSFKSDSLLPIILISLTKSRTARNALWKSLINGPIYTYFESLRFRADLAPPAGELNKEAQSAFLEDLLDGITQPLRSYFPAFESAVIKQLTGFRDGELGIEGRLSTENVDFHFVRNSECRVLVTESPHKDDRSPSQHFVVNLALSNLRLDSGRLIGGSRLQQAIVEAIDSGALRGRGFWHSERLLSRLQYLEKEFWHGELRDYDLLALKAELLPQSDAYVTSSQFGVTYFAIAELIDDIDFLIQEGRTSISPWWNASLQAAKERRQMTIDEESEVLSEHFRRVQLTYAEICEETFGQLSSEFGMYRAMPLHWDICLGQQPDGSNRHIYVSWRPVRDWADAGADCRTVEKRPSTFDEGGEELSSLLERMGRYTRRGVITTLQSSILPLYQGRQTNGKYDGWTSVHRRVVAMLKDDLRTTFRNLPGSDRR